MVEAEFHPIEDSCVWKDFPDSNYGSAQELRVSHHRTSNAFIKFDISEVSEGSKILEARLRLYAKTYLYWGNHATGKKKQPTIRIHSVPSDEWSEGDIKYNNAPQIARDTLDFHLITGENTEYTFNVKPYVQKRFTEGETIINIAVTALPEGSFLSGIRFASREDAQNPPILEVTYEPQGAPR
jgi:hypothetical protein